MTLREREAERDRRILQDSMTELLVFVLLISFVSVGALRDPADQAAVPTPASGAHGAATAEPDPSLVPINSCLVAEPELAPRAAPLILAVLERPTRLRLAVSEDAAGLLSGSSLSLLRSALPDAIDIPGDGRLVPAAHLEFDTAVSALRAVPEALYPPDCQFYVRLIVERTASWSSFLYVWTLIRSRGLGPYQGDWDRAYAALIN